MSNRFRRLRHSHAIRNLVRETHFSRHDFVQPYFIVEGKNKKEKIESMPGIYRYSIDLLLKEIESYKRVGGEAILLFGVVSKKDAKGSGAYKENNLIVQGVKAIKKAFPELVVMTDVCLCGYTDHGHCGVIKNNVIDNDASIKLLGQMAVSHAQAGADIVAPSDMMDFRVQQIRNDLDKNNQEDTLIMSYAVKYSSAFYGPFRDAAYSSPGFGDRKSYQMDYGNKKEALKEALQDVKEGADLIMVKPALSYLDIIALLKTEIHNPIVAYSVSGEYSMIKAAAKKKWIDERAIVMEIMTSIKRAGADIIISYYAKDVLKWIKQK